MSDKPLICDRARFIDCANGVLLDNKEGKIVGLGDGMQRFVEAVEAGKTVYLTVGGKIVSRMINTNEAITEERWSGAPE